MKSGQIDAAAKTASHGEADAHAVPVTPAPAAGGAAFPSRENRYFYMNLGIGVLVLIALVAALYLARAFIVPLLIGILSSYALYPVVDWLKSCRIPRPVGAALVLVVLLGSFSWIAFSLSGDATAIFERLPEAARKLRQNLSDSRTSAPTALQNMNEAAKELEGAAADAGAKLGARKIAAQPSPPPTWVSDYALAQSRLLITIAAQTPIIVLLTYFLLAAGDHFRRKLVQLVGRSLSRKKDTVRMLNEIDVQVQRYLLAMLISNALVGIGTWLSFEALGMGQAGVWGVAAGVLHFIPYLGPALIALASGMAGFLQFESPLYGLAIAGVSLLVASAVGFVFMTWMQSRFARVNAAVLFITLLFFGWLWGVWGLLLGAPMVAIVKVVCDRVDSLNPFGELLGR